ncbi:UDP-glycosyltransferase family protein [Paracoccaceae bacterium]|nr:UDP-glycosyltransferase family protein [Paracoccaceae bacterium]
MCDYLSKIKSLQSKIEIALKESNFEKLALLSTELETSVETLVDDPSYKNNITQLELADLQKLLSSIRNYQKETSLKFKHYTLDISRKRRMHQAYKQ